tara:strand:- start:488 stop:754 length:267 start_codon:yes stop_codon:yes gene_type:complete
MKKAKQAMTNSYGRIENSYKQQNAAKRRNVAKKRADYLTQGMVKQKTLNKMKKHYNKRLDKLENDNKNLKIIIKELIEHAGLNIKELV